MGFIERFFKDAKKIKAKDVLSFISQKIEENMNLDYKDITTYHDPDKLAINVASFANVDGGLIILGVAEGVTKDEKGRTKRIYPEKITWGDVSLEKEKLENQLAARIQPYISELVVRPIRNKASRVIFLIDIPKSNSAPHMSSDHLYHKRMNFRTGTMEHYEVANLFRINWTMKQKFVESIYEPLASILEKHAKSLMEYHCPDGRDFDDILSRTYYRAQMPVELLERINYYIGKVQSLNKEEYFVRESVREIVRKNITNYLREKHGTLGEESVVLEHVFVNTKPKKHEIELDSRLAYSLLLTNVSVGNYVSRVHWRDVYEEVSVSYGAETFCIDLHDFDELVWSKCLRETFQNTRIIKMKKSAEALSEEAWDIIDDLIKY